MDKHERYLEKYKPDDLFWGIGIENERYLEFDKKISVSKKFTMENHKPERYCINYYNSYKPEFKKSLDTYFLDLSNERIPIKLPLLMNSHSFEHFDRYGETKTTCVKHYFDNPNFAGETLYDFLCSRDDYFYKQNNKKFVFDGDTIEFMTQNFYNTTVADVIEELREIKKEFIEKLQTIFSDCDIFREYGKIKLCEQNYGFAVVLTNLNNLSIFNNMTYHFNFTLPTLLDKNKQIVDKDHFIRIHRRAIKALQYVIPLLICKYGAPDVLSEESNLFAAGSQRCAVSRYTGIGIYDTDKMITGKQIKMRARDIPFLKEPHCWYNIYDNAGNAYIRPEDIGFDFNFNNFLNHGIEFRIFEHFPDEELLPLLSFFVYIFEHTRVSDELDNPIHNKVWNQLVYLAISYGKNTPIKHEHISLYEKIFDISIISTDNPIDLLHQLMKIMQQRYKKGCYPSMMLGITSNKCVLI